MKPFEERRLSELYRMGHEKVARRPFTFAFDYCFNLCIYAMLFRDPPAGWTTKT